MKEFENILIYGAGIFPDFLGVNSATPSSNDGTEWVAGLINNGLAGPLQALLDYANVVPDGVIEAAGTAQILDAINKGYGIGPGKYVQWGLEDDPSVTGDRVILLAGQGVLVASYPDLDKVCFIGGTTPDQVAAIAAGKKFYRSSDAAGLIGDAAGPYLQLPTINPSFKKKYSNDNGDFTVTGGGGGAIWTTREATAIPYQTNDGIWRIKIFVTGTTDLTTSFLFLTISGIDFDDPFELWPAYGMIGDRAASVRTTGGNGININGNTTSTYMSWGGDFELTAKPTWADDFTYPWGITY